jgi:hypothetical protein
MKLCASAILLGLAAGVLVLPTTPPKGFNSFDIQASTQPYGKDWNETVFRQTAADMAKQLLPHGYDTIVLDGGCR